MDVSFFSEFNTLEIATCLFAMTYVLLMVFLTIGLMRLSTSKLIDISKLPTVTVIVSSRNEEKDLPGCIESLEKLDYPQEKLEIILVNDRSTDSTWDIIEEACSRNKHFFGYDTADYKNHNLEAKGRGISFGFKYAKHEWVFITDGDAYVHPKWLRACLGDIDESIGMVGGALLVEPISLLAKLERACWAFVQMFNLGMSGWGVPFACVGPNMAIRRSIYEEAGGLEGSEFTVAEDLALLKMVTNAGYKIRTYMDEESAVKLKPVPSMGHLISQQRRWLRGGIDTDLKYLGFLTLAFGWGLFISIYMLFGWIISLKLFLIFTFLRILIDIIYLSIQRKRLKTKNYVRNFWLLTLYIPIICSILPISFIFTRKIYWKGDDYEITYE